VVEWSRTMEVRLSEWCCSVSMVRVQMPSREEKKIDSSKNLILTYLYDMNKFLYINHHIIYLYIMHFLLCIYYTKMCISIPKK
jgi:hypothetical protein